MARLLGLHTRGARRRTAIAIGVLLGGIAGGLLWWLQPRMSACEREVRTGDRRAGLELCLRSYRDTGNQGALYWAAKAHLFLGEIDDAEQLARRLPSGALDGDAHWMLSYIALRQGRLREAQLQALLASNAHMIVGDRRGLAGDAVLLSQVAWRSGDFTGALRTADEALTLAVQLGESHTWRPRASGRSSRATGRGPGSRARCARSMPGRRGSRSPSSRRRRRPTRAASRAT
jgi:hypothetical protein